MYFICPYDGQLLRLNGKDCPINHPISTPLCLLGSVRILSGCKVQKIKYLLHCRTWKSNRNGMHLKTCVRCLWYMSTKYLSFIDVCSKKAKFRSIFTNFSKFHSYKTFFIYCDYSYCFVLTRLLIIIYGIRM